MFIDLINNLTVNSTTNNCITVICDQVYNINKVDMELKI